MKQLFRIFLSLSLLLMHAHSIYTVSHQENNCYSSVLNSHKSGSSSYVGTLRNHVSGAQYNPYSAEENTDWMYATEVEEESDESIFLKKYPESDNYFTTLYSNQESPYLASYTKKCLPYSKHFSYLSSHRYITLQTFRV